MLCRAPISKKPWHYGSLFSEEGLNVHPDQVPEYCSGPVLDLSVLLSKKISFCSTD